MPAETRVYAVGGVEPGNIEAWRHAGASGFGIGSPLFKPGQDAVTTGHKAATFVAALLGGSGGSR